MNFAKEIEILKPVVKSLRNTQDLGEKQEILLKSPRVAKCLSEDTLAPFLPHSYDLTSKIALFSLVVIGQEEILATPEKPSREQVRNFLLSLVAIDRFYENIGGIIGYHLKVLELLTEKEGSRKGAQLSRAPGIDLTVESPELDAIVNIGIEALPESGEIYPIGGLGSRLDLHSKTGEPLPAGVLPFLGRTLLEGLIRDVQAREFLYYRLYHRQVTIPIAMMTSHEKKNAELVQTLCEKENWFARPKESFFLFSQISVPVVSQEGKWVMEAPLLLLLHPGGHGALWRMAEELGVFRWFLEQGKHHILIRQINNPIAGIDLGLLALIGVGKKEDKAFGFASCERLKGAAEGVLVLKNEGGEAHLSNIEYTEFKQHGVENGDFPANTNILYVDIKKVQRVIKENPLPGLMLNMKHKIEGTEIFAGRLESMMQNISDTIPASSTFLTYNERRRTISATKRSLQEDGKLIETPEGAYYDLLYNTHRLLKERCGVVLADFGSEKEYLEKGPSHLFLYHPALGPLFKVIAQKIQGGRLAEGSELQLEIADALLEGLDLEGSLLVEAHNVMGHLSEGILRYSEQRGKCVLKNVRVRNKGIHHGPHNSYWTNQIRRHETFKIVLEGHSEFHAEDATFTGSQTITVPDGEKWTWQHDGSFHVERLPILSGQHLL